MAKQSLLCFSSDHDSGQGGGEDAPGGGNVGSSNSHPDLSYLSALGPVVPNLRVGKDGEIRVALKEFGDRQHLRIVALGMGQAVVRDLAMDTDKTELKDIRLRAGLDPEKSFSEQRRTTVLNKGKNLVIADPAAAVRVFRRLRGMRRNALRAPCQPALR